MRREKKVTDEDRKKRATKRSKERQEITIRTAINKYQRWTTSEKKIVMQAQTTDLQIAQLLGRTEVAVHAIRYKLVNLYKLNDR